MGSNCTNATELWAGVQSGNKKALSDLYEMYADALYEFGKSYSSDSCLIEDCIHDLFVELYMRRKRLPVARNVKNYLFTILRRKITELSKSRPLVISPEDDHIRRIYRNQEVSRETEIIHKEEKEELGLLLTKAIHRLSPKQRKGVTMRFYENKTYEEMALSLDISIDTARTLIYRSLKSMRGNWP
ncbi:RNA polymerase sigma factor, sigma-70 family [Pricia antarctica]|uniref:RNA polymerase sigma factor, sigma-70 family n=1 Tax=Pricia antarctica TaxID=641691 RepID=A0A1G7G784_9FLAO|nr:sigma-70 family RNA polymerase sigma factor [Pricia antarctica]SDE83980.1 RNA polymerase sigma factor, sigma-70 family [Pricia antarctica]